MTTWQRVWQSLSWLGLEQLLSNGLNVVVVILIMRQLGPGDYGQLSYLTSLALLLGAVSRLGLDAVTVRRLAVDGGQQQQLLDTVVGLRGGAALLAFLAFAAQVERTPGSELVSGLLVAASLLFMPADVINQVFVAQLRSRPMALLRMGSKVTIMGLKGGMLACHAPLVGFALVYTLEFALQAVSMARVARVSGVRLGVRHFSPALARELLCESWPLLLASMMAAIYVRIDQVMLTRMVGPAANGTYAAATKFADVASMLPFILLTTVFPLMARLKERSDEQFRVCSQGLFTLMGVLAMAIALGTSLASGFIGARILGGAFSGLPLILSIHVWSLVFTCFESVRGRCLMLQGLARYQALTGALGAVVNIGLNLVLIPSHGGVGAAIATLISYAVATYLSGFAFRPLHDLARQMTRALLWPLELPQARRRVFALWRLLAE